MRTMELQVKACRRSSTHERKAEREGKGGTGAMPGRACSEICERPPQRTVPGAVGKMATGSIAASILRLELSSYPRDKSSSNQTKHGDAPLVERTDDQCRHGLSRCGRVLARLTYHFPAHQCALAGECRNATSRSGEKPRAHACFVGDQMIEGLFDRVRSSSEPCRGPSRPFGALALSASVSSARPFPLSPHRGWHVYGTAPSLRNMAVSSTPSMQPAHGDQVRRKIACFHPRPAHHGLC